MSSDLKFRSGKYKGCSIDEIIKEDPSYCHFLVYKFKGYVPKDEKEYLSSVFMDPDSYFLSFGPYKGMDLKDVINEYPDYIEYLLNDEFIQNKCFRLKEALNKLLS